MDTSLYRHVSTWPGHQIQKWGYVVYLLNVDTSLYNFSQNILNKDIFRMWIHRYIDMYPHSLDNSFLVFNVQGHLRNDEKYSRQHILDRNVR